MLSVRLFFDPVDTFKRFPARTRHTLLIVGKLKVSSPAARYGWSCRDRGALMLLGAMHDPRMDDVVATKMAAMLRRLVC